MRRLRFRWAGRMAILLLAGVCIAEDLLQQEVISREVGLFVGQSPQPPPPVLERVAVTNGGFESVPIVQNLLYWTNRAGWTGSGNPSFGGPLTYGRGNNGGLTAPSEGEQAVGLQKDAVIFTPLTVPHPGAYFLSWRHASRAGQVNPYIVFTNRVSGTSGTAVGPRVPVSPVFNTSSIEWSTVTLQMWFNQSGTVLLGFAGLNSGGGDETVVIDEVQLMRYVSEGTRTLPDMREVVSREASFFIEGNRGGLLEEVVSREVSFTVDAVGTPPPVLDLALTVSPTGETVTVDWSGFYNPWAVKDVAAFHVYQSATPFDSVAGRTPTRVVPADTLSTTFTGLPAWRDSYYAVVAVDALGNAGTEVVCSGAYVLMPELVSREASFFVGNGPDREVISRETSLLIDNPGSPVAVGRFLVMPSANGDSVTLDWSSYNSWQEKDVVHYRVYYSDRLISSLEGVPWVQVPGETFRWTFNGLTPWTDHFFAVIPVDGLGNSDSGFHYQGAYVLMPEVVSREAGVFVGDEPVPPYREVISREASLVVADAVVPAPVTGITSGFLAGTSRSRYGAIDLDWTAYAEEEQRDIVRYRLYSSDRFFTNVTEMAWTAFPENPDRWDGRRRATIQGLDPAQIHYVAVVAEDAAGKFNPNVYSVSAKASIGSLGDVRNLAATPKGGGWELRWDVGSVGDNVEDFLKEVRFYPGRNVAPMSLGPLVRSQVLSPLRAVGGTTVKVTTVDVFGSESPGVTLEFSAPQPFVGTDASLMELTGYVQDLLLRDGTFPVAGLTLSLISGPTGLVVTNGVLTWTPTEAQGPSTNLVTVTVTDGSLTTTNSLTLTVLEVNLPPTLAGATNATDYGITNIIGQWDFNGDLEATVGGALQYRGDTASITAFQDATIGGKPAKVMSFGAATWGQGYIMPLGEGTNGGAPAAAGGTNVNQYTLIMDVMFPAASDAKWRVLFQTDLSNASDGDLFVNPDNGIGISGQYHGKVIADTWHRLAFAFDLNVNSVSKYIDGVLVNKQSLNQGIDGRWSLGTKALLFSDENGETSAGMVNSVQMRSGTMSDVEIAALGGATAEGIPGGDSGALFELVAYYRNLLPQDTDLPAQSLTVALVSGPTGLVVTNGVLAWTPTEAQGPSTNVVTVTVTDGSLTTTNSLTVTVREVNAPPILAGATNATINELLAYTQDLAPQDTDLPAQPLTVALVSGPTGLVVTNGVLNWTPAAGLGGSTNPVVVRVSDGVTSVTNAFVLTVRFTLLPARLSGLIDYFASAGGPVRGVVLAMGGSGSGAITTGADGAYSMEMPGGAFTVAPTLETDTPTANGVSTADIAILRRHILGITTLDSAHKVLAGDVNGSSSVTTADITLIRRLILGVSTNFTGGLWRFVPSDEVFTNAMSPWTSRRGRSYATMPTVATGHDFKAIKLGDVNGSWKAPTTSGASTIQAKSKPKAQLVVGSGRDLGDGVTVHSVTLRGVRSLTSLQFTLAWDPAEAGFAGIEAGALKDLGPENLGTARAGQGLVSVSWDPANGLARDLGGEAIVLGLKLKARPGRTLSRLTVPERPTALEVTEATVPVSVGVVGWSHGAEGLPTLARTGDGGGPDSASARLRVLGPDAAGQVILEVTAAEGQTVQVQWSMDLKSWTPVWQGSGEGPASPIRLEPQSLSPSEARFWRVIPAGP